MRSVLVNYGGILFFYIIIILGIMCLCIDNGYSKDNSYSSYLQTVQSN